MTKAYKYKFSLERTFQRNSQLLNRKIHAYIGVYLTYNPSILFYFLTQISFHTPYMFLYQCIPSPGKNKTLNKLVFY